MNKQFTAIVTMVMSLGSLTHAEQSISTEYLKGLRSDGARLDVIDMNSPPEVLIPAVGDVVRRAGTYQVYTSMPDVIEESSKLLRKTWEIILPIPGHAEYYGKRINEATSDVEKASEGRSPEQAIDFANRFTTLDPDKDIEILQKMQTRSQAVQKLANFQRYDFPTLAYLPSPETVRVLGEMLTDERGRMPLEMRKDYLTHYHRWIRQPNSVYAANALATLPLNNKPHAPRAYSDDLEPPKEWINWFQQIKEGRRTFSFEGDPNEYDLNGIASKVKNPDMPRAAKRPPVADHASAKSSKRPEAVPWPWIAGIAAAILGGISWIILGKRKAI